MENVPKKVVGSAAVDKLREAVENEAKWIYFLTLEGIEQGLAPDFAAEAMAELGRHYAATVYAGCDAPERLCEKLMNRAMREGFEAEPSVSEDALRVGIGYCPMLNMWSKLTGDAARREMLCGVACEMYRGLAEGLGFEFRREGSIACGAESCALCFTKKA